MLRRYWAVLPLLGGALLLYFEVKKGDWAESWFWIALAVLVVVLSLVDLIARSRR